MKIKRLTRISLCIFVSLSAQISLADSTVTQRVSASDAMGKMILQSISLMGIPYKWGGNTPATGLDCSGFIRYVFKTSLGIELPRTVAQMAKVGKRIPLKDIEPGDLVFLNHNHHIGMYIGHNKIIESPHTGESIKITPFSSYWKKNLVGIKRIVQEDEDNEGNTTLEEFQHIRNQPLPAYKSKPARRRYRRTTKSRHTTHRHKTTFKHKSNRKTAIKSRTRHKLTKKIVRHKIIRHRSVHKAHSKIISHKRHSVSKHHAK